MYVSNSSLESLSGVTSKVYHIFIWIFLATGVLGNVVVLFWRLSKKELRYRVLSLLIVSLAAADLLWCCHFLIQEAMLFRPLYLSGKNDSYSLDGPNKGLCLTATFLTYISGITAMLIASAIAMYVFCAFLSNRRQRLITIYTVFVWIVAVSVATAALVMQWRQWYDLALSNTMPLNVFSLKVVFGCIAQHKLLIFPAISTTVMAVSSLVILTIYISLCIRLPVIRNASQCDNSEIRKLKIRLAIISVLNVVGWWPACIIYWYSFVTNKTVGNGKLPVSSTEFSLLLTVAVSAINPLIYSEGLTRICKTVFRAFRFRFRPKDEHEMELNLIDIEKQSTAFTCRISCCCCICEGCPDRRYRYRMSSVSDTTGEQSLFTE
jgi:hypothetical protein